MPLEKELNRFGYTLTGTYHMFLPQFEVAAQGDYPVKWFYGDEIMGIAGCSEDALHWMQIGIDIMPRYRSKGVSRILH